MTRKSDENNTQSSPEPRLGPWAMAELLRIFNIGSRKDISPPQYAGDGDVEGFLAQFHEVAEANEWKERERNEALFVVVADRLS